LTKKGAGKRGTEAAALGNTLSNLLWAGAMFLNCSRLAVIARAKWLAGASDPEWK
jgi:hypothetical protein